MADLHSPEGVFCVFQEAEKLVATVIPKHLADAAPEVAVYLKESVGNSTRIDYGTGIWARMLVETWLLWEPGAAFILICYWHCILVPT